MPLILLAALSCRAGGRSAAVSPQHIATLFTSLQPGEGTSDVQAVLAMARKAPHEDPNWPALAYLVGEVQLKQKDLEGARATFRDLAAWAAADPYKDGWGGSGLAAVALFRWLQALDARGGTPDETSQALEVALNLYRTRLFRGMVQGDLLPALPLLEETNARLLAHVLWRAHRKEADAVFLAFLGIDSQGDRDETDEAIAKAMIDEGQATRERLDLFRFRRQLGLVMSAERKPAAADGLRKLWSDTRASPDVRAEAGYEWSRYFRTSAEKKKEVIEVLTAAYALAGEAGGAAERALYLRGMVQNSVDPKQPAAFFADMTRLLEKFPRSRLADDALYELASEHLFASPADLDRALAEFQKLRAFEGTNDWLDSAYFLAAFGLVDRGTAEDLVAADRLLAEYVERFPDGVFRLRSLFWRGRIAEHREDAAAAERLYEQVVRDAPYDYYGLRARMHLEDGAAASVMALPRPGSRTSIAMRAAYRTVAPDVELDGRTAYHDRLRGAESSGLYGRLVGTVGGLGKLFRRRLDTVPLAELDGQGAMPAVALLLALRQDAAAARDSVPTADNELRLAGFVGRKVGDWPSAAAMTSVRGDAPHARVTELQNDPRFLATSYPGTEILGSLKGPLASAAWPIDGSTELSESLMYAVMRRESSFYPGAISPVGALGLFQIMPSTFERTEGCWRLAGPGERPTPASYLFDPVRNMEFWSCWVKREFEPKARADVPQMLVRQHAGSGNLEAWKKTWKGRSVERDTEMQVEALRFPATQAFVRSVLADVAIVEASGIFAGDPGANGKATP